MLLLRPARHLELSSVHRLCRSCGHFAFQSRLCSRKDLLANCPRCELKMATRRIGFDLGTLVVGLQAWENVGDNHEQGLLVLYRALRDLLVLSHESLKRVDLL
jgi:hypothetical protein